LSTDIHFLDYVPRKEMVAFHNRLQRYAILVTHRQFGKTVAAIMDMLIRASQHIWPVGRNFVYIAPTQKAGEAGQLEIF
jgi:phage terminase large subunit